MKYISYLFITLFCATQALRAESLITELPISAIDNQLQLSEPFFLSSGIPLSEGTVQELDKLYLIDAANNEVPAQFSSLAYWLDGSIKWLGISPVLSAETQLPLRLYQAASARQSAKLTVNDAKGRVLIENSELQITIGENGGTFTMRNRRTGHEVVADIELEKWVRPAQKVVPSWQGDRESIERLEAKTFTIGNGGYAEVEIEEEGPVRAVVRVKGRFRSTEGEEYNRYDYRLYVYADTAIVRWQPSWIFDGNPETDVLSRIEARVLSDVAFASTAHIGVIDAVSEERTEQLLTDKVVQDSHSGILLDGEEILSQQLGGWVCVGGRDGRSHLGVAVKDFWQNYPSGFKLEGRQLVVGLWPGFSTSFLDLARTSDGTGDGEHGADLDANAVGTGKTFDLLLSVGSSRKGFAAAATLFDLEPLFYPGSKYMVGTGALGPLAYEDHQAFPRWEGYFKAITHWLHENRRDFKWYGFIDYGDVRTNFNRKDDAWNTKGRYGWRHGSGDVPQSVLIQYFRTGDPVAWKLGAPHVRHILDVDTVHDASNGDQPVGAMHRRGQDHWSGSVQSQYTYSQGAFLYHYLSGDLRARSVLLEEIAKWQGERRQAWSANAANTVVRAWEATADPQWLELAEQQMEPHMKLDAYDNFRFFGDYITALLQYQRLTGSERAAQLLRERAITYLDPQSVAYYHPSMDRRGGRLLLPAFLYFDSGDIVTALKYPVMINRLPPPPPSQKSWNRKVLDQYAGSIPPWGINASLSVNEMGRAPYFMAALQEEGWTEKKLRSLPAVYGTKGGSYQTGTYSSFGLPQREYDNEWETIPLPSSSQQNQADLSLLREWMNGLPAGGALYVNNVPFEIQLSAQERLPEVLRIEEEQPIQLVMPEGATALHLLGPMIENGDWREGQEVIEYTLHLSNGEKIEGVWRNLFDLNDFRGFHYAQKVEPGRFWQLGGQPRVNIYAQSIDFEGNDVERVELRNTSDNYRTFFLAATASMPQNLAKEPLLDIVFAPGGADGTIQMDADTLQGNEYSAEWLLSDFEKSQLRFRDSGVVSDSRIAFQVPVDDGHYLVEISARSLSILGGVIEIGVSGNALPPVAVSGDQGDRFIVPALVKDGVLRLSINSVPALHCSPHQGPAWELRSVKVFVDHEAATRSYQQEIEMEVIQGELLAEYATYTQSVGAEHNYSFWSMESLRTGTGEYRVSPPRFPQDIILEFDAPITMTGYLFSPLGGYGPKEVTVQMKESVDAEWEDIGQFEMEENSLGLREGTEPTTIVALRFLMNGGHNKELRISRADVYGSK